MRHYIRRLFLTLSIGSTAFISQAQQPSSALEFNDAMAGINDSISVIQFEWGTAYKEAKKSGRFDLLKPYRERLENHINRKLDYVLTLKDINNSKPLRLAVIELLTFEKRVVQDCFLPFEQLKASVTKEELQKMLDNLKTLAAKEKDMLAKVSDAQLKYGEENGFDIEGREN